MDSESAREIGKLKYRLKILENDLPESDPPTPKPKEKPENWVKRNAYWLWPSISIVFGSGVVGTILSLVVDHRIDLKLADPIKRLSEHTQSITVLETKQTGNSDLLKIVLEKEMSRTLALRGPEFRQELPQLSAALDAATLGRTPVLPSVFVDLGRKLAPVVKQHDPDAWRVTVSLAGYRSIFNSDPTREFELASITNGESGEVRYMMAGPTPAGESTPKMMSAKAFVSKAAGARLQPIGQDANPERTTTQPWIVLTGGGMILDGYGCWIRRVPLRNLNGLDRIQCV